MNINFGFKASVQVEDWERERERERERDIHHVACLDWLARDSSPPLTRQRGAKRVRMAESRHKDIMERHSGVARRFGTLSLGRTSQDLDALPARKRLRVSKSPTPLRLRNPDNLW